MKFFSGIILAVVVAVAFAAKIRRTEIVPTTAESPVNIRDKRGFILTIYTAPIAAVPIAHIATEEATKNPEIANLPATIEKTETVPVATVPVAAPAIAGIPYAYTYSTAVPYAYPAYRTYVPYYPTFVY